MLATKNQINTDIRYYNTGGDVASAIDDGLMSKEEYLLMVQRSLKEYEDGNYKVLTPEYRKELFDL
jgi:hypothetical protein